MPPTPRMAAYRHRWVCAVAGRSSRWSAASSSTAVLGSAENANGAPAMVSSSAAGLRPPGVRYCRRTAWVFMWQPQSCGTRYGVMCGVSLCAPNTPPL